MEDESGDIKPGFYHYTQEEKGAAAAELEQKRAEILDGLRGSKCFTVSVLNEEGGILHSTFVVGVQEEEQMDKAFSFLAYACLKLVNDIASVMNVGREDVLDLLGKMLEEGVGEEW